MKKNFLFGLIGAGALILSGSVGFAAWQISGANLDKSENVSIKADYEITDSRITVKSGAWDENKGQINFAPSNVVPEGTSIDTSKAWLTGSDYGEKLQAVYTLLLNTPSKPSEAPKIKAVLEETDSSKAYETVASAGQGKDKRLTKNPTTTYSSNASVDKLTYTYTITCSFGWGQAFNYQNPYVYFNSNAFNNNLADEARTNIGLLEKINNAKFTLKITA